MKSISILILILAASVTFGAGVVRPITIPAATNSDGNLIQMTDIRQAVSDGREFFASRSFTAATQEFYILTGGTAPRMSITVSSATSTSAVIDWYESVSVTGSTGTAITKYNMNRNLTNTGGMVISYSPTAMTGTNTQLPSYVIPSNAGMSQAGSDPVPNSGWILKRNTAYFVRVTPANTGVANYVGFAWKE